MFVVRLVVAIPFFIMFWGILFVLLFFSSAYHMKNPEIYASQLRKTEIYDFLSQKTPELLVQEIEREQIDLIDIDTLKEVIHEVCSAKWFQNTIEKNMQVVWPYIYKTKGDLKIKLPLKATIITFLKTIQHKFADKKHFDGFYDSIFFHTTTSIEKMLEQEREILQIFMQQDENLQQFTAKLLKEVFPPDQLNKIFNSNLTQVIAFVEGNKESTLSVNISDFSINILNHIEKHLRKPVALKKIIRMLVVETLPYDIEKKNIDFVLQELPLVQIKSKLQEDLAVLKVYLQGSSDSFSLNINEYKQLFVPAYIKTLVNKLEEKWMSLEEGSLEETETLLEIVRQGRIPPKRPKSMTFEQILEETNIKQSVYDGFDEIVPQTILTDEYLLSLTTKDFRDRACWENDRPLGVLKINIGVLVNEYFYILRKFLDEDYYTITAKPLNNLEDVQDFRMFMASIPYAIGVIFFLGFIFLTIIASLCSTKKGRKIYWGYIVIILASILILAVVNIFEDFGWPKALEEMNKLVEREVNLKDKLSVQVGVYTMIALKNSFVNDIRFFVNFAIVSCILLIFTTPIFKLLLRKNNREQVFRPETT